MHQIDADKLQKPLLSILNLLKVAEENNAKWALFDAIDLLNKLIKEVK